MKRKRRSKNKPRKKRKVDSDRAKFLRERSKKHKETVVKAKEFNIEKKLRGRVRCAKLPYRFSKTIKDKKWPNTYGFMNINVCSSSKSFRGLSPMVLGPIEVKVVDYKNKIKTIVAKNLENLWQASKVWSSDYNPITKKIRKGWFSDRDKYFADSKAHRHIKKGTGKNVNVPLFSLWVNQKTDKVAKLKYVKARKRIYCPIYKRLASKTAEFEKLKTMLDDGYNIQILGYDGFDFEKEGMTLQQCYDDASRPFGHELLLVSMLLQK